jgi:hypothetical protein
MLAAMKEISFGCLLVMASVCVAAGCSEKGGDAGASSASPEATSRPATSATAAATSAAASATASAIAAPGPSAAPSAAPSDDPFAAFKDLDMSSFHKLWKGYSVKAPEGATIKQGASGPRITKDKDFGIELSFTDTSLNNTIEATKECVNYDQKCAVLERTKDLVVTSASYQTSGATKTTYAFHMLVRPGGTFMACKSAAEVDDRSKLDILKKACSSITKA